MHDPRPRLWLDIETYSSVDLKKYGVYRYAAAEDFEILMCAWQRSDGDADDVQVAVGWDEILLIPGLWDDDVLKVAHNAQFERVCFSVAAGLTEYGAYLDPANWHDTQAVAAEYGYPQKLDMLAKALGIPLKDSAGTRLINLFCKPRRGVRTYPADRPEEWLDFLTYCYQDVVVLREADKLIPDHISPTELRVYLADQYINDRGIRIDRELAEKAEAAGAENATRQKARIRTLAGIDNPNSIPQMMAWVREQKLHAKDLQRATVERLLKGPLEPVEREVLELRQELALAAPAKYSTALGAVLPDSRLRGTLRFFGAHTGRWAGRGTQVHNLPREAFVKVDPASGKEVFDHVAQDTAIADLMLDNGASSLTLKKLIRAMFVGPFTVVDYSAIEARVLAWLAGEEWVLQAFRDGRDIYVETGERMGGLGRPQGKIAVLALGYNGGANSLRNMAGGGFYYNPKTGAPIIAGSLGAAREQAGGAAASKIREMGDDQIREQLVYPWRAANPNIVQLWQDLGDAFGEQDTKVGDYLRVSSRRLKNAINAQDPKYTTVRIHLPSGRAIYYHGAKFERYQVFDPATNKTVSKQGWRYANPKDPFNTKMRIGTYGGRLAENVTQAVARDLLAEALVRLESKGYKVATHVHDEILVEGVHDVERIARIMSKLPAWATGLPLTGEGFTTHRYKKG